MRYRSQSVLLLLGSLLVLLALAAPAPAQTADTLPAAVRSEQPLPMDPGVIVGRLSNGLRYYIRVNREPRDRVELRLAVNTGSVLEDPDQRGLAHFLEHMAFNGTESFARQDLVGYLESVGMRFGPDINAYTSFDETIYKLTLPTDTPGVVKTGVRILEEWARGLTLDSLEVEKERGVVIEEWRLGQGAAARMQREQFPVLMHGSRYAERLPIGTPESLASFEHSALKRFYRDWYRPDLMAVVAVGDFDPAWMEALIRRRFGSIPTPAQPRPRPEYTVPAHEQTLFSIATDPEATGSRVSLYLKRAPRTWNTVGDLRGWIIESLASGMLVSRLHEQGRQPDAPFLDVSSFQGRFIRPLSTYMLSVRTEDGGIRRGLEALLTGIKRAAEHGFAPTELEREKRALLRTMEQRYREREKTGSGGYAAEYVSHFLYGGTMVSTADEYQLYQRILPTIGVEEVSARARAWIRETDRVVLVNAPEQSGVPVPTVGELRTVVEAVREKSVPAYTDSVSDAPLVSRPPTPAEIVAERHIPEIGTLEWELANGVRVVLKPTDFKEDEVLLAARSPGGTSRVPDSSYIPALTAAAVVQAGGVGELSTTELSKRLAGKRVGVGASIGALHEGVSGAASAEDLETLFQLVYLKFTAPRVDSAAFEVYREQAKTSLRHRAASPGVVFGDTLQVTLSQNHPRARPPSVEMFDRLDLGRSFEIYRDRFSDASDFTFYLVGNFDSEVIRPLVQRYLGGLPSTGREETWRDMGIRPPIGVVRKTVYQGMEPRARTQIVFTGPFDFNRENLYALRALEGVLRLRLRDRLREDLGGTYGVRIRASGGRDPHAEYQVAVGFGAAPARLEELARVVFAQIDSLKADGPTEEEIAKVREMQLRSRETDLRTNHFWLSQLIAYDRYGWDPREIPGGEQEAEGLNADTVRAAARRYLDMDRYVRVSLYPESDAPR